jgi:hypothetical protein
VAAVESCYKRLLAQEISAMFRLPFGPTLAGLALLGLTACSTDPYQVRAQEGAQIIPLTESAPVVARGRFDFDPTPWSFGLCYSELMNEPADLLATAREVCPYGHIESRDEDLFWNGCALLQPRRATFVCYPAPEPEPAPGA